MILIAIFSALLTFYDPVFQKDLSIEFLSKKMLDIRNGSPTSILLHKPFLTEKPTIVFSPSVKLLGYYLDDRIFSNSVIDLKFKLGFKVNNVSTFAQVDFFNFHEPNKFPYWHPFADVSYLLYSFDEQPIVGGKSILDINVKEAYVEFDNDQYDLLVGRANIRVGEGLIFSGNSYPLDYIYRAGIKLKNFRVISAFAVPVDTFQRRSISYQVLEWTPHPNLVFTLYEAVSHSGEDVFKYFNPVILYYERQRRGNSNSDNLLGGFSLRYLIRQRASLFFELLNDDIVVFQGGTSKYALNTGLEFLSDTTQIFRLSAVLIPRFTYTHVSDTNSWHIMGNPIGYPRGNDLIDFYLSYLKYFDKNRAFVARFAFLNKGEGTLIEKWEGSGYPRNIPYPTGNVRRDFTFMLGYKLKGFYLGSMIDLVYRGKSHIFGFFFNFESDIFKLTF